MGLLKADSAMGNVAHFCITKTFYMCRVSQDNQSNDVESDTTEHKITNQANENLGYADFCGKKKIYPATASLSLITKGNTCSTHAECLPSSGFQMSFPFSHNCS